MTASTPQNASQAYDLRPAVILLVDPDIDPGDARAAITAADLREIAGPEWRAALSGIEPVADIVMIEGGTAPGTDVATLLYRAVDQMRGAAAAVIATVPPDLLDQVADCWLDGDCQLLCNPTPADRIFALHRALDRRQLRLNDVTRDAEAERLRRLNEEVARIADTLVRLTRGEPAANGGGALREPANGYRGPDDGNDAAPDVSADEVRAVIRARRLRAQFFAEDLFADPAWDMLLDLFAAKQERRRVSVSSLCIAAAVPPTTALRWIGGMHEAGLFERHADPDDRRRAYIALSRQADEKMRGYFAALRRQGLNII
ncbi:MarR family winged helix-turn-helix transcriptional regulator [Stakelama tenebrarum]|uniref:Winged helix-turn-helix transcriptional regulator n=1 Tax=Stakelama tenebrarum TaxID=2711215 RepID=A0A6G6YAJ3_9SPHN|nr:MarR family winged helix-turn-helix transcriptional regulator [Sphingosinithalassobacter tenebrarum]QIG81596.1 winged helix-turn-helix transcriptional regulator [Sphingosinithalassobacter tenebrarum]